MYYVIFFLISFGLNSVALADNYSSNILKLTQKLQELKAVTNIANQSNDIPLVSSTINFIHKRDDSINRAKQYQKIINHFPVLSRKLSKRIDMLSETKKDLSTNQIGKNKLNNIQNLNESILEISNQLLNETKKVDHYYNQMIEISNFLSQLPKKQEHAIQEMLELEKRMQNVIKSSVVQSQISNIKAEYEFKKALVDEFKLEQLSTRNRQEIARMIAEIHQRKAIKLDNALQKLRSQLSNQNLKEAEQAIEQNEQLAEYNNKGTLPRIIADQFLINQELASELTKQSQNIDFITLSSRLVNNQIIQAHQTLFTLRDKSQWIGYSNLLGEALRNQVALLPKMPKSKKLDHDIVNFHIKHLRYETLMERQKILRKEILLSKLFSEKQNHVLDMQLDMQYNLLTSLISGNNTLLFEANKLKFANIQLHKILMEIKDSTHRYLFWTADVNPINSHYLINIVNDFIRLISYNNLEQIRKSLIMIICNNKTIFPILGALILVIFGFITRHHYYSFLESAASKVGKVTQDRFNLTVSAILLSILVSLPLPMLWATIGLSLQNAWPYKIAIAIGDGIITTLPLLWLFMISANFAHPNGLFVVHFKWPKIRVDRAMSYYSLSIGLIIPLIMIFITIANLEDKNLLSTLGRLCFVLICFFLSILTVSLKRAGVPLYLNKNGDGNNVINQVLWNLMITVPIIAAFASCIGYLATSQALLVRVETSLAIWCLLLIIYYIIRRWMLIQRRRIAFDRARQRRAEILANRARNEEDKDLINIQNTDTLDIEEPIIDLDVISAQSLRLVRSILTLIALFSVIALWSEIHSAFGFLENIHLWDSNTTIKGITSIKSITLGSILIAIMILIVTIQLVRNMPALLELAILQHLNLTPGTGYAITTLTKYILMLIGSFLGISLIGIEWSKLQWLVAALGVGLGFGLQEIFANFICGLIILFEKPIRIGDTVTIRELTGSITRINTRATTITDWDKKEIIVPNRAFITEQFVNWSLSDSITRVVLTIPTSTKVTTEQITCILKQAADNCSYVLNTPAPEVFLVDLQQGIQLFELRVHVAEMSHRMPLRHELHQLILQAFKIHKIKIPFPPFQMKLNNIYKRKLTEEQDQMSFTKPFESGGL